jgi:hypothetical protein
MNLIVELNEYYGLVNGNQKAQLYIESLLLYKNLVERSYCSINCRASKAGSVLTVRNYHYQYTLVLVQFGQSMTVAVFTARLGGG